MKKTTKTIRIISSMIRYKFLSIGKINFCIMVICLTAICSCKKLIEVDPPVEKLVAATAFEDDRTANSVMAGLYYYYSNYGFSQGGSYGISVVSAMSSDDLKLINQNALDLKEFNNNTILAGNVALFGIWDIAYRNIYTCNSVIEGLEKSSNVSAAIKNQLQGEAKFLRAFTNFYLVNMFGNVPYVLTTDYEKNTSIGRMETDKVYELIIQDLKDAKDLLSSDYSFSDGHKSRLNKYAASALLARAYLYTKKYPEAEIEATNVIGSQMYTLASLNSVFLIDNTEAIWQLEGRPGTRYTFDGQTFITNRLEQTLTTDLVSSFENGDLRLQNWILQYDVNRYTPNKYKDGSAATTLKEANTVFRLAEQYLIRAEARAMQNKLVGSNSASSDLNMIRERAGLNKTGVTTQELLLAAIQMERRHEFFTEGGHRWFDLKRTGQADGVLNPLKSNWSPSDKLYPIPQKEVLVNPNMTQNPGYN